jgi:hypothetical protein
MREELISESLRYAIISLLCGQNTLRRKVFLETLSVFSTTVRNQKKRKRSYILENLIDVEYEMCLLSVFSVTSRNCLQHLALKEPQCLFFSLVEKTGEENLAKTLTPRILIL